MLIGGPFNPTGPGDTPSRRRIFVCRPSDCSATEDRRARAGSCRRWRGAPTVGPSRRRLEPLLDFYDRGRASRRLRRRHRLALRRMLIDPAFLFRVETRSGGRARREPLTRVSDLELASRLSFFLWSSIPDDELLTLAAQGRLARARRARAAGAADAGRSEGRRRSAANFAGQWLYLRNLQQSRPDTQEFPDFDDSLRQALPRRKPSCSSTASCARTAACSSC